MTLQLIAAVSNFWLVLWQACRDDLVMGTRVCVCVAHGINGYAAPSRRSVVDSGQIMSLMPCLPWGLQAVCRPVLLLLPRAGQNVIDT